MSTPYCRRSSQPRRNFPVDSETAQRETESRSDATIINMRIRLTIAALLVCAGAFAQNMSVNDLVGMLRSDIKLKMADKEVAAYLLKNVHLTQKLDDKTIEELQGEGLGPKTVAALRALGAASANLPVAELKKVEPPAPPPEEPPPSREQQQKILDAAREYALNYSKSLPNFICAQNTRRYGDPTGAGNYRLYDNLLARLTYYEQHEKYETITVNDKPSTQAYESIGGSISTGEFGSMLMGIFDPQTDATFSWSTWRTLNAHKAYVFKFSVDQPHSRWQIEDRDSHQKISPAYTGFVWIDVKDNSILEFTQKAVDLPSTFRITEADTRLHYDSAEISGVAYVLPSKAVMRMRSGKDLQMNEITFHNYHKYTADTTLKFEDIVSDTPAPAEPGKKK